MYRILVVLSLISVTISQYPGDGGIRADVVFDENNERFDVDAINAVALASKYQEEDSFRRKSGNGLLKNLADRIRKYHDKIEDSTSDVDIIPQRRQKKHDIAIKNPILRSIHNSIKGFKQEYNLKVNSNNKDAETADLLRTRLVEVASNSLKGQDINNNVKNPQVHTFSEALDGVKDDYNKKLKKNVNQDAVTVDRRASQIVNKLHQEIRRNGAEVALEPVDNLLMHYAFPMKVKLQGFINVPNVNKK